MTQNDIALILARLAVIENKLDISAIDAGRIRRLEIAVAVLVALVFKGEVMPLLGGS